MIDYDRLIRLAKAAQGPHATSVDKTVTHDIPHTALINADTVLTIVENAQRWDAFVNCARIRFFGWAGADKDGNQKQDFDNDSPDPNYVHFSAEFWSKVGVMDPKYATPAYGAALLTTFADAAIRVNRSKE